jgi:hypothetical protein
LGLTSTRPFTSRSNRLLPFIFLLIIILLGTVVWFNYRFAVDSPGGTDFLVHWVGTRALLIDGLSPYTDEVAVRIQTMVYGRPAQAGEHELRVAYPLYSQLVFLPYALIGDYTWARAIWNTTLEIALVTMALLALTLTGWKPGRFGLVIYLLFSLTWYFAVRGLINGNAIIFVALFITGAVLAIRSERDELAGILLAFATIKPQVVVLFIPFVLLWAISHNRWRLVIWTGGTLLILIGLAMIFIPDWILQNIREVLRYPGYNPPGSPQAVFKLWFPGAGNQFAWGLTILMVAMLIVEWVMAWRKSFRWFLWTGCLTLLITQWSGIQTDPGNFIVLFLPLVLVFAVLQDRYGRAASWVNSSLMIVILVGLWWIFLTTVEYAAQPIQSPVMFFPLPILLFISLYWVRWPAITAPPRSYLDLKTL